MKENHFQTFPIPSIWRKDFWIRADLRFSCKSCLDTLCYENYQRLINISKLQEISTVSTLIFWGCLNTEDFHPSPIIYSWVITWIEANKVWSPFVSCSHTRSNTQRIFSCSEEIMNVPVLTEYTDSTMNVRFEKKILKRFFNTWPRLNLVSFLLSFSKLSKYFLRFNKFSFKF